MYHRNSSRERRPHHTDDAINSRQKDTVPAGNKTKFCVCVPPPPLIEGRCPNCKKPRKVF